MMCTPVDEGVASVLNDSDAFQTVSYPYNISGEEPYFYNMTKPLDPYRQLRDLLSTKVSPNVKDPFGRLTFGNICIER